jgi:hypothetical protein
MGGQAISPQATATFSAAGTAMCAITPPSGTLWQLSLAAVSTTSAGVTAATLALGSSSGPLTFVDSTQLGNSASSGKVAGAPFYHGAYLWATWTGGDPGAQATLQAYGTQRSKYRAGA